MRIAVENLRGDSEICDYERIGCRILVPTENHVRKAQNFVHFAVADTGVDGDMALHAAGMCEFYRVFQLVVVEIFGSRAV